MRRPQMFFALMISILIAMSAAFFVRAQSEPILFERTNKQGSIKPSVKETVIRSQNILVNTDLLRLNTTKELAIDLFGQKYAVLLERETETAEKKGSIWYGKIKNQPASYVMLSRVGEVLAGSIVLQTGGNFQIRYLGNGVHVLYEIDPGKFPIDEPKQSGQTKPVTGGGDLRDTCGSDNPSEIDVMVAYTATARAAAGGNDAMQAEIYLASELTNQSYINSNITQRLRLVHLVEVAYSESGNSTTDKIRMQNPSDGQLDNLLPLRNAHAADLVAMITESLDYCGEAFDFLNPVSNAAENKAYAVIKRSCAGPNLSFAHELGHLMGARHNWLSDGTNNAPYPYNHGFLKEAPTPSATSPWRTVMAYQCPNVTCSRIPYWSNPTINFPTASGDPMGIASGSQPTDNRQTLNNTAATVANFRCSSPGRANVWMKDTWEDTGAEPDSATVGQDMWKSPYIWVRKMQDTGLTHQHQHQNPAASSSSFVYAKLHNGASSAATGMLEFYFANASTSLTWPGGWTNLASVPVTVSANSSKVIEANWAVPATTGHFCLLARWVSPGDPMSFTETADIDQNVRRNNNLTWRNLNIEALADSGQADEVLEVRGLAEFPTALQIKATKTTWGGSFLAEGQLIVTLDQSLMIAWKNGGAKGRGFRSQGKGFLITNPASAVFENLILKKGEVGKLRTSFRSVKGKTPQRTYLIDVVQWATSSGALDSKSRVVGGVGYQVSTEPIQK
jgi:hypothetical protein